MPYIVTTHRYLDDPTAEFLPGAAPAITRQAVATLEEAHNCAFRALENAHRDGDGYAPSDLPPFTLPEFGGTIGPLPDGTVIDIEPVSDFEMKIKAVVSPRTTTQEACDTYNTAQQREGAKP